MKSTYPLACFIILLITACQKEDDHQPDHNNNLPPPEIVYDISELGLPQFISTDYIELDSVSKISKFRSGIGHDYSDDLFASYQQRGIANREDGIISESERNQDPLDCNEQWSGDEGQGNIPNWIQLQ